MLVKDKDWERIRASFSEEEKKALRRAVTGEAICPKGLIIDDERLPPALLKKLKLLLDHTTIHVGGIRVGKRWATDGG